MFVLELCDDCRGGFDVLKSAAEAIDGEGPVDLTPGEVFGMLCDPCGARMMAGARVADRARDN